MNKYYATYLYLIPVFVLIQVLILNEILFFNYINPFLYLSLIISLPLKTPKWFILIYAFTLGLLIDIFGGSLGFHSTATVFVAFLRQTISKITIPHNILADHDQITLSKIGNKSFITFSLVNCPRTPDIEFINIKREAVVTITLGFSAFNKKRIGLKNIPPPIPTIPEIRPRKEPIKREIKKFNFLTIRLLAS